MNNPKDVAYNSHSDLQIYKKYSKFWDNELNQVQLNNIESLKNIYDHATKIIDTNKKQYYYNIKSKVKKNRSLSNKKLYDLIVAAFSIYFYRLNDYRPITIWIKYPALNRLTRDLEDSLSSSVPLTVTLQPDTSFNEAIKLVGEKIKKIKKNKTFIINENTAEILEKLSNAFQIQLEFVERDDMHFSANEKQFTICISESNLSLFFPFDSSVPYIFGKIIFKHISNLLINGIKNPQIKINQFSLITLFEKNKLYRKWNNTTHASLDLRRNIPALIEDHSKKFPRKIAISYEQKNITYNKLKIESDNLANYLIQKGIRQHEYVAVFQDRSIDMLISILGVLKAGGVYIPIDINYPIERVKYILENSNCKTLITKRKIAKSFHLQQFFKQLNIIEIDQEKKAINKISFSLENIEIKADDYAYLIYTSGSTGKPKGVLITHQNVINYATWFSSTFKFSNKSCIDFSSSIAFDLSVSCTLVPLMKGGKIKIASDLVKENPFVYLHYIHSNKITHVEWVPDYFHHLLDFPEEVKKLKLLKWIMLGGDAIVKKDIEKWATLNPTTKLVNEYGPTECTVATVAHIVNKNDYKIYGSIVPIGKPAFNTQVYVLDQYLNICPVCVSGELYIGGLSVAAGYLNQELTQEKFIKNPFTNKQYDKLYKTGDIVCWLPDGNLKFFGRKDTQAKIRGYRIELEEIENTLLELSSVKQCKIIAHLIDENEKILVAYLITNNKDLSAQHVKKYLQNKLPDYMVPCRFIFLDEFPTNTSGKVDLNALSKYVNKKNDFFINPDASLNEKLKQIWCYVLKIDSIKLDDNYFKLGGTSLTILKILSLIHRYFHVHLHVGAIFKNPTVRSLAKLILYLQKHTEMLSHDEKNKNEKLPQVICLQNSSKKKPIFFIHPVGGGIFIFNNLAKYLCKNYVVYGIQDPGVEIHSIRFSTLQEMASCYLHAIRQIQKNGPYLLSGASFGATLTIEIARQFFQMGEKVDFIGLFDGWAHYPENLNNKLAFKNFMHDKLEGLESSYANQLLEMQFSREQLLYKYKIPTVNEITLFKAKEIWAIFQEIDNKFNGWRPYAKQLNLHVIPGDHESMFEEPHVKILARELKKCLAKIS